MSSWIMLCYHHKCVYKTKVTINGILEKLKARFIARGFEQWKGVDFEVAPIIKQEMEKIVVGLASQYGWQMEH